ncbi:hypothetical protein [Spongiimicrobium sp. 3-5]|uniref:hypothetical protein n=1 Tax=Spongiimicrobium sp. 3-5 TaxID=3332596 RepID=UPI00397EAECD
MIKEIGGYLLKLLGFSLLLFAVHYYVLFQFFTGILYFPLWEIYLFNAILVLAVYGLLRYYSDKNQNMFKLFLILTTVKMVLVIVYLLPLFLKKSEHIQLEVFNFFIVYFVFLAFEILALNNFLQKS